MKVFILDPDELMAEALKEAVTRIGLGPDVVTIENQGLAMYKATHELPLPDLLIASFEDRESMRESDHAFLRQMRSSCPGLRIVALVFHGESEEVDDVSFVARLDLLDKNPLRSAGVEA